MPFKTQLQNTQSVTLSHSVTQHSHKIQAEGADSASHWVKCRRLEDLVSSLTLPERLVLSPLSTLYLGSSVHTCLWLYFVDCFVHWLPLDPDLLAALHLQGLPKLT